MTELKEWGIVAVLMAVLCVCALLLWVARSSCEASAYNHVTGKNVSTWDAMFLELRVQEGAQ